MPQLSLASGNLPLPPHSRHVTGQASQHSHASSEERGGNGKLLIFGGVVPSCKRAGFSPGAKEDESQLVFTPKIFPCPKILFLVISLRRDRRPLRNTSDLQDASLAIQSEVLFPLSHY